MLIPFRYALRIRSYFGASSRTRFRQRRQTRKSNDVTHDSRIISSFSSSRPMTSSFSSSTPYQSIESNSQNEFLKHVTKSKFSTTTKTNNELNGSSRREEMGLYRLLNEHQRSLLSEQRELTTQGRELARQVVLRLESTSDDTNRINNKKFTESQQRRNALTQHVRQSKTNAANFLDLEATFSVVIAGEFNAGKSTLINALLGQKRLESGALPTTDSITIVAAEDYHDPHLAGQDDLLREGNKNMTTNKIAESTLPLGIIWHTISDIPLLNDLTLIDTPGTNSTWLDHTERTLRLLPSADLILFVTSADRPFSDSERTMLRSIQAYRKNIIVIVNKMDILDADGGDHGQDAKAAVVDFVRERSSELLGARPVVIPLSARDALSAKLMEKKSVFNQPQNSDEGLQLPLQLQSQLEPKQRSNVWHRSQFETLETFLKDSLTATTKIKSKLSNPIGVTEGIMKECQLVLEEQSQELQSDVATLAVLETQFDGWKKELTADLQAFQVGTTDLIRNQGERCQILLHRWGYFNFHYNLLIDRTKFDEDWEAARLVVSSHGQHESISKEILSQVEEISENVATRGRAQGQAVIEYLGKRPAMKNQSLVGSVTAASRFEDTRKNLSDRLSSAVKNHLRPTDEKREEREVFQSLQSIAALSGICQMATISSSISGVMGVLDPLTAALMGCSFGLGSGICYALGTSKTAHSHDRKWKNTAKNLQGALITICDKEVERVSRRILDGVGPYTRFVDSEREQIQKLQDDCENLSTAAQNLRNRIGKLC